MFLFFSFVVGNMSSFSEQTWTRGQLMMQLVVPLLRVRVCNFVVLFVCLLFTSSSLWPPRSSPTQSKPPGRWWWDTPGYRSSSGRTSSRWPDLTEHAGKKKRWMVNYLLIKGSVSRQKQSMQNQWQENAESSCSELCWLCLHLPGCIALELHPGPPVAVCSQQLRFWMVPAWSRSCDAAAASASLHCISSAYPP